MITAQEIINVSPLSVQKRLNIPFSLNEIEDFIGNFALTQNCIPTSKKSKMMILAVLREICSTVQLQLTNNKLLLPHEISQYNLNYNEQISIILDCPGLTGNINICNLDNKLIATYIQLNVEDNHIQGVAICDFGLDEKQTIHLRENEIIRIPNNSNQSFKITLKLAKGNINANKQISLDIPSSVIGLIIDTRIKEILKHLPLAKSRELISKWQTSLDLEEL